LGYRKQTENEDNFDELEEIKVISTLNLQAMIEPSQQAKEWKQERGAFRRSKAC